MLIAACRLNIPTVLVSGGPMLAGRGRGEQTDLNSLFDAVGQVTAGTMTEEECHWLEGHGLSHLRQLLRHVHRQLHLLPLRGPGHRASGNGTIPAVYSERIRLAKHAAHEGDGAPARRHHRARHHQRAAEHQNAMAIDMAFGGSTNTMLHLTAIAQAAGCPVTMQDWG